MRCTVNFTKYLAKQQITKVPSLRLASGGPGREPNRLTQDPKKTKIGQNGLATAADGISSGGIPNGTTARIGGAICEKKTAIVSVTILGMILYFY